MHHFPQIYVTITSGTVKQILVVNLLYFKMHSIRLRFLLPLFFHCEFLNELLDYFVKKFGKYVHKKNNLITRCLDLAWISGNRT